MSIQSLYIAAAIVWGVALLFGLLLIIRGYSKRRKAVKKIGYNHNHTANGFGSHNCKNSQDSKESTRRDDGDQSVID